MEIIRRSRNHKKSRNRWKGKGNYLWKGNIGESMERKV
ncbi:hypothetical protein Gohar_002300, partial [Gossypium harknessii]|nr:hypothetical protein [Gossypium harknessii]